VDTQSTPPLSYAKLLSGSMLMRTDFGSMFKRLSEMERQDVRMDPSTFVDWVHEVAGLAGTGRREGLRAGHPQGLPPGHQGRHRRHPGLQISRNDRYMGILFGKDELSAKSNPAIKDKLEGLGRLGNKFDTVGDEAGSFAKPSGVIMEFRNMSRNVVPKNWTALATSIYDYLVSVNERSRTTV
jgi:hypothetical protein